MKMTIHTTRALLGGTTLALRLWACTASLAATMFMLVAGGPAFARSAQWNLSPGSGDWNTNANWTPATGFPNGPADTATFDQSDTTGVSISADTEVGSIVFNAGASAFTISASPGFALTLSGVGITNNSGLTQNFATNTNFAQIYFVNSATAGSSTVFTNNGGTTTFESGGTTQFTNASTAGSATFINNGATNIDARGGFTEFDSSSTAGSGIFITNGAAVAGVSATTAPNGATIFFGNSSAANGTFITNGATINGAQGGATIFYDTSTAGSATLIANGGLNGGQGGTIAFIGSSGSGPTGGTCRVEVFGNGLLQISFRANPGITVGSIEGDGIVSLGAANLTVGSNNLSTIFSGVMQDGEFGTGGLLTKIGTGTLTLSGANTYTGGTTVNGGVLQVENTSRSGTGSGSVTVNSGGKLAGTGTIAGDVTNNGIVNPGDSPGTLHVGGNFSQSSGGTLDIEIASLLSFDQLIVSGTASLAGTLDVTLDGYTGHAGDVFNILTSSGLSGNFATIDLPTLSDGLFFRESTTSNDVLLTVGSSANVPDQGSTLSLMASALAALLGMQRLWLRAE